MNNRRNANLKLLGLSLLLFSTSLACIFLVSGEKVFYSHKAYRTNAPPAYIQATMSNFTYTAAPGQRVDRILSFLPQNGNRASLTWTPPPGATNFSFNPAPEKGGPPFQWKDSYPVNVSFNLPPGPLNKMVADTLQVSPVGHPEAVSAATTYTLIQNNPSAAKDLPHPQAATASKQVLEPLANTTIPVWHVLLFHNPQQVALTTKLCQDTLDLLRSEAAFVSLRVPKPTVAVTESLPLPLVFDPTWMPLLSIRSFSPSATIISGSLEYRPDRQTFAQNALPSAPGEHWVTLGLSGDPLTCPAGLNIAANQWNVQTRFVLDLSARPDNCLNCVLPYYVCYAGQNEPLANLALNLAGKQVGNAALTSFQGDGITCSGPNRLEMFDSSQTWDLYAHTWTYISPTVTTTVNLQFLVANLLPFPLQVSNLTFTSDVPANWQWYAGDNTQPNLSQPLTFPLALGGDDVLFAWLVGSLPPGTASGLYTVGVTATTNAIPLTRTITSQVWVGDWVVPPPLPAPAAPLLVSPSDGVTVSQNVTLSWQAGAGEVPLGFELDLDGAITVTHNTTQTFTPAIGAHTWRVRGFNDGGYSAWSPMRTFTITVARRIFLPLVLRW